MNPSNPLRGPAASPHARDHQDDIALGPPDWSYLKGAVGLKAGSQLPSRCALRGLTPGRLFLPGIMFISNSFVALNRANSELGTRSDANCIHRDLRSWGVRFFHQRQAQPMSVLRVLLWDVDAFWDDGPARLKVIREAGVFPQWQHLFNRHELREMGGHHNSV
jgi:hypothetical protein